MSTPASRKLPLLEEDTRFFWTSGADGVLRVQRCAACGHWQHPPLPRCPACQSEDIAPAPVSGRGRVTSFTINYERWLPNLETPFVFAVIELEEQAGLYVLSNVLAPSESVTIGMPVEVTFEQNDDVWLPLFRPRERGDD